MHQTCRSLLVIPLLFSALTPSAALADCGCFCVNGQIQAICRNTYDVPPICQIGVCTGGLQQNSDRSRRIQPPDLSVFDRTKSINDYTRESEQAALERAQQIQTLRNLQLQNQLLQRQIQLNQPPTMPNRQPLPTMNNSSEIVCTPQGCSNVSTMEQTQHQTPAKPSGQIVCTPSGCKEE